MCIHAHIKLAICIPKGETIGINVLVGLQYLICGYKSLFSCKAAFSQLYYGWNLNMKKYVLRAIPHCRLH